MTDTPFTVPARIEKGRTIIVGLTGSVGMGKSTVAQMFAEAGVPVYDADMVVHDLLRAGGGAVDAVGAFYPPALQRDENGLGYIDRTALGDHVFTADGARQALENILHPLVRKAHDDFTAAARQNGTPVVVMDIPLLFETDADKDGRVDLSVVVSAPRDVQMARVLARGWPLEKFQRVSAAQMDDADKRARADVVIDTGTDIETTRAQVRSVLKTLITHAKGV